MARSACALFAPVASAVRKAAGDPADAARPAPTGRRDRPFRPAGPGAILGGARRIARRRLTVSTTTTLDDFQAAIRRGIPDEIPDPPPEEPGVSHAPRRPLLLTRPERALALRNALRYFPPPLHARARPRVRARAARRTAASTCAASGPPTPMHARPIGEYPARCAAGRRHHADDPEQPRPGRGAAPARADHLRRQRHGLPELGAVPADDAVPVAR